MSSVGRKAVSRLKRFAESLEKGEDLTKRFTCRSIRLNIQPMEYSSALVKETRSILGVSQPIFAQFLGVSTSAVQDWEQGQKPPRGAVCRLMDEIRQNPEYWIKRLKHLAEPIEA